MFNFEWQWVKLPVRSLIMSHCNIPTKSLLLNS